MTASLLLIQWYIIDYCTKRRNLPKEVLALHFSATVEVSLSSLIVIFLVSDSSSSSWFAINSCRVTRVSDWYTVFYNPRSVSCTQEAVYPLFSMIMLLYGISLLFLLFIRPLIVSRISDKKSSKTIYLTLYAIPALTVVHIILCGVIYYLFPYVTIIASVISLACHFACRLDQRTSTLFLSSFKDVKNVVIILGHWLLHILGIIALTHLKQFWRDIFLLMCVPLPTFFYILTAKYSDPSKIIWIIIWHTLRSCQYSYLLCQLVSINQSSFYLHFAPSFLSKLMAISCQLLTFEMRNEKFSVPSTDYQISLRCQSSPSTSWFCPREFGSYF